MGQAWCFGMRNLAERRFLVVGNAKTGTTVISHTLMNAAGIRRYHLEPQTVAAFEALARDGEGDVVKILFGQWMERLEVLDAIIDGRIGPGFTDVLFILRDPRATEVSALLYWPYNHFLISPWSEATAAAFLDIFRQKEADPGGISMLAMGHALHQIAAGQPGDLLRGEAAARAFAQPGLPPDPMMTAYADYIDRRGGPPAQLLRYEYFVAGRVAAHPLGDLLRGSREVGPDLDRTRRTGGREDWTSFVTPLDLDRFNHRHAVALERFGYPREVALGGPILPEHCSGYVARILAAARSLG